MPSRTLSTATLERVSDLLDQYGSSLTGQPRSAIAALLDVLEDGLRGTLAPSYYLSAIDPGIGKSLSVASFLRAWKEQGFQPASSVLIGLSRLEEINTYIASAGLDDCDVAVLTSSEEHNALGLPKDLHSTARVMFTTQQMIERRTRGKTFAEAEEFHFQGAPRTLRIWDESLVPAQGLLLSDYELAVLPGALRTKHREQADAARTFLTQLWEAKDGERLPVPEAFGSLSSRTLSRGSPREIAALETAIRLAGQDAVVVEANTGEKLLVGASQPLPADFAPVVIMDASGRVRSTYEVWQRSGAPLVRLPAAANDYRRLHVKLWERSVGKSAVSQPGAAEDIVKALAELIDDDDDGNSRWLFVSYKDLPIEGPLRASIKADLGDRLQFLTWGMHHGTNAFATCDKVVLIGQLTYGTAGYLALAAACGASITEDAEETLAALKAGEYRHNLLQALTRASVRRSVSGVAGICTAYVIASSNVGMREMLPEVFPGCDIERWAPDVPKVGGRAGQLIELLKIGMRDRVGRLAKGDLAAALGMQKANFSRLLRQPAVRDFLEANHIRVELQVLVIPKGFDPWPGGDFTIEGAGLQDGIVMDQ